MVDPITAGLVIGGVGSLVNAFQQGKLAKENKAYLDRQSRRLDTMFNKNYYQGVFENEASQSAIKRMTERMRDAEKIDRNSAAITGASDEARVASKGARFKGYSDAITTLAEAGATRKERMLSEYNANRANLDAQYMALNNAKSQSWSNLTNNIWNTTGSMITAGSTK